MRTSTKADTNVCLWPQQNMLESPDRRAGAEPLDAGLSSLPKQQLHDQEHIAGCLAIRDAPVSACRQ